LEKQIRKSVRTALIFLGIGLLLGTLIVFAATPSSTFYISSGIYPGAPSYTVWREGSGYFAKDQNGQLKYSGSNASLVTQNCINSFTSWGGEIFFASGSFIFDTSLTMDNTIYPTHFRGEGKPSRLQYTGTDYFLKRTGSTGLCQLHTISDLEIRLGDDAQGAIHLNTGTHYWNIHDIEIWGSATPSLTQYGIVLNKTTTGVYWNSIAHCRFYQLGESIRIEGGANANHIVDPIIRTPFSIGINILSGSDTLVLGGRIEGELASTGVYVNSAFNQFIGLDFELTNASTVGYNFSVNSANNRIFGGRINVYGTAIVNDGTNNRMDESTGWTTVRSGTAEASNDDWVSYGATFVTAPDTVILTVQESDARYIAQVKSKNTTHFQLYLYDETAGAAEDTDKTVSWFAELQP